MAFAVCDRRRVTVTGLTRSWTATTGHRRFCPASGSSLFGTHEDGEVGVRLGILDEAPSGLTPATSFGRRGGSNDSGPVAGAAQQPGNRP
jgi:hypothetical protein